LPSLAYALPIGALHGVSPAAQQLDRMSAKVSSIWTSASAKLRAALNSKSGGKVPRSTDAVNRNAEDGTISPGE
jgi:hypothetical protein